MTHVMTLRRRNRTASNISPSLAMRSVTLLGAEKSLEPKEGFAHRGPGHGEIGGDLALANQFATR